MAAKVRNALTHCRPLARLDNVEMRLHEAVFYNSIYRADDQLLINQHTYGMPAAHSPVFCLRESGEGNMMTTYLDRFEKLSDKSQPLVEAGDAM
jgi:hypothetical protein